MYPQAPRRQRPQAGLPAGARLGAGAPEYGPERPPVRLAAVGAPCPLVLAPPAAARAVAPAAGLVDATLALAGRAGGRGTEREPVGAYGRPPGPEAGGGRADGGAGAQGGDECLLEATAAEQDLASGQ